MSELQIRIDAGVGPFGVATDQADPRAASDALLELAGSSGMRRIVILLWRDIADPDAGGSEMHADHIAREWAAAGIDVTMRTSSPTGRSEIEERGGYRVVRRSSRTSVFGSSIRDQLLGRLGPSDGVLEVWNGVPYLSPFWCRQPNVTFIHHVHREMWDLTLPPRLATLGRVLERRVAPPFYRRSRVLTPSATSKQEIIDYLRLPAANISVVEPGVDPMFTPGGAKAPDPTILAVGRLVPYKRVHDLIDVTARVRERVPRARLVIVGDGHQRSALERLIDERGARPYVELLGRVSDAELVAAYRSAWVLASASIAEGWGLTITEAAACGTPAVVTRVGGHCDAVAENTSGLLAATDEDLVGGLTRVLEDARLRGRLADGALEGAASRTWAATALRVLEELTAASQDHGSRSRRRSTGERPARTALTVAPPVPARAPAAVRTTWRGDLTERIELLRLFRSEKEDPGPFNRRLAERAVGTLPFDVAGASILDLGAGRGEITQALRLAGARAYAVDIDGVQLGYGPTTLPGAVVGDGTRLPYADGSFDFIVCSNMLEHTPAVPPVLAEIARVLRPGGVVWLSWTNWYSPWGGHEIVPFHYLGPRLGLRVWRRCFGEPRKNTPFDGLWPTHVGQVLRSAAREPHLAVVDSMPRYYPSQRWITRVPVLRELLSWNCLLLLERSPDELRPQVDPGSVPSVSERDR